MKKIEELIKKNEYDLYQAYFSEGIHEKSDSVEEAKEIADKASKFLSYVVESTAFYRGFHYALKVLGERREKDGK